MMKAFNKEDKMLLANLMDKYKKYEKTGISTYSNFLNELKLKLATNYLKSKKIPFNVYEKYEFLEKKIIYFGEYENFVTIYKIYINNDINHSNILGTLFSLGFEEDLIGDIIVEDNYFYYTNLTRLNTLLENEFTEIKRSQIKLNKVDKITLTKNHFEEFSILVSSMRLDNILSKIINKSRTASSDYIKDKLVLLNYEEVKSPKELLKEGDILSIRKHGKFKIGRIKGFTKKNNYILNVIKYI